MRHNNIDLSGLGWNRNPKDADSPPRDYSILTFIVLSYLLSWSIWLWPFRPTGSISLGPKGYSLEIPLTALIILLGNLGPGVAALILITRGFGASGLRGVLKKLVPRSSKWLIVALLIPTALVVIALVCGGRPFREVLSFESSSHWLRVFAFNLPFAPLWEELGWRGYMLPGLQAVRSPLISSIIVGVIWGFWHTPLYLRVKIPGSPVGAFQICFFFLTIGLSILFCWVYNASKQSLSAVILLHASVNSSIIVFLGAAMAAEGMRPFWAVSIGVWFFALALLLFVGPGLSYAPVKVDS